MARSCDITHVTVLNWLHRHDSNARPLSYEAGELSDCATLLKPISALLVGERHMWFP